MSVDFEQLAREAAAEAYSPRAKRCWFFHQWTMWELEQSRVYQSLIIARRHCVRCGKPQHERHWMY